MQRTGPDGAPCATVAFCFRCWPVARHATRAAWEAAMARERAEWHAAACAHTLAEMARRRAAGDTGRICLSSGALVQGVSVHSSWRGALARVLARLHVLRPPRVVPSAT